MAGYSSSESSSPLVNYSIPNMPMKTMTPDASPVGDHMAPLLPFSSSGGGKDTGEHVVGVHVFMMQGCGNKENNTNTSNNQSSDQDASDVKPFIVDSGASVHATGDRTLFSYLEDITTTTTLTMANGSLVGISGRGTVRHHNITLHDVLFAPGLAHNIVSVSKFGELDYIVEFRRTRCFIREDGTDHLVGEGHLVNGLFELDFLEAPRT